MIIGGGAVLTIAAVCAARRKGWLGLGKTSVTQTKAGGMTLTHYRSSRMPIEERLGYIQDQVWKSVQDPRMRKLALKITKHCPSRDGQCEARAVFDYVYKNVRYTGDVAPIKMGREGPVEGVDLFQSARRVDEFGAGDCDDHSILSATLLALNGISPRLRVTAMSRFGPDEHIYTVAGLPKNNPDKWVALDTTLQRAAYGREAPYVRKRDFVA